MQWMLSEKSAERNSLSRNDRSLWICGKVVDYVFCPSLFLSHTISLTHHTHTHTHTHTHALTH